jgi:hypothetical protein
MNLRNKNRYCSTVRRLTPGGDVCALDDAVDEDDAEDEDAADLLSSAAATLAFVSIN